MNLISAGAMLDFPRQRLAQHTTPMSMLLLVIIMLRLWSSLLQNT